MHVTVNDAPGLDVDPQVVFHAGVSGRLGGDEPLEPAPVQRLLRLARLPAVHEQVEIRLTGERSLQRPDAFPMAIADTPAVQGRQHGDRCAQPCPDAIHGDGRHIDHGLTVEARYRRRVNAHAAMPTLRVRLSPRPLS